MLNEIIPLSRLYFLIEGPGRAMELVTQYVAERSKAVQAINDFAKKFGASSYSTETDTLNLVGLAFDGPVPQGWKSIGGTSRRGGKQLFGPRKGSAAHEEMLALPQVSIIPRMVAADLGIPTVIDYVLDNGEICGGSMLSLPGSECGFAYPSTSGPFLLWIPDVEKAAESCEKSLVKMVPSISVAEAIKKYRPAFDGCRQILREEWDVIVAQHALKVAQEAANAQG